MNVSLNISVVLASDNDLEVKDNIHVLPQSGNIAIGIIMLIATIFGMLENLASMFIFYKTKILQKPTNYYVMLLAVLDFLQSTIGIPMVVISSFAQSWIFGEAGCVYYGFVMTILGLSSISTLTVISIDRYLVIVKPKMVIMKRKFSLILISSYFVLNFLMSIFPLLGWSSYVLEGAGTSCSVNWKSKSPKDTSYSMTLLFVYTIVPLGSIAYCYISIFIKVRNDTLSPRQGSGLGIARDRTSRKEYAVAKFMFAIIGAFAVSWFPYAIVSMWSAFANPSDIPTSLAVVPTIMAKISVIWNPIIYIIKNRNFRSAIILYIPCLTRCILPDDLRILPDTRHDVTPSGTMFLGLHTRASHVFGSVSRVEGREIELKQMFQTSTETISTMNRSVMESDLDTGGVWIG